MRYSNQQITNVIAEAPFRTTTNIPSSRIQGSEFQFSWPLGSLLNVSGSLGFLDSEVAQIGVATPATPNKTANLNTMIHLGQDIEFNAGIRHQGRMYLRLEKEGQGFTPMFRVGAKNFIDMSLVMFFKNRSFNLRLFAKNLSDTRQATDAANLAGQVLRTVNQPRSFGAAASFEF